ncbi:response regulator transcription factor [Halalkalibacter akibai]|uniref:Two-component response regulator n=1 Tax=Halalkalibacter akibai (strain ATCC 43226 / DSM 21942 / CIP 109018 / JCM 9157 / 1139) TaxID=1236973 RepID=W4QVL8_HALA3|nr:response regulator transcription factor [Halalkalibacter akibai]GAE36200.1 two-component response regulator [Halalkalibacter akibai JCM 9157]
MWRVVIIDDDHKVLRGMKKIIPWEELNCVWVGEAPNGKEGLEVIKELKPDIIITDIYMPVMNGLEMIQELKELDVASKVIILSGFNDFEYARQAMRLQIADYLSKPASIDTITEVLSRVTKELKEEQAELLQVVELKNKISLYEPFVEKEWIKSIVTGTVNLSVLPSTVLQMVESWEKKQHVVLAISYDQPLENTSFFKADGHLFRFAAKNIINEVAQSFFEDFQYIELHIFQSALCIHFEENQEAISNLNKLTKKIEASINTFLQVRTTVTIGSIKSNWREISDSMKDCVSGYGNRSVIHPVKEDGSASFQQFLWSQSIEAIQKLSEAIRYADQDAASEIINSFFEHVRSYPYSNAAAVRLGIEMWTVMTYSLHDIGIRIQEVLPEDFDLLYELSNQTSWQDLNIFLNEKVAEICHHQQWDENLKHKQLVEKMIAYLNEHLSDNITLQDIANELYISRNYLGQIFKKIIGESFKNYITRVRMEAAKKMIQEGNYLIYEVSEKVGYVNPAYFTTTFKKYTGYTPTELIQKRFEVPKKA